MQHCYPFDNKSCFKEMRAPEVSVILYAFSASTVLLTVFGNLVVIISFSHFRQLHTPSNLLVLSLAVADFMVGIFSMPFKLIQIIENCWYFGDTLCFIYFCISFLLTSVSISNLVFIAIDRYIAVCDPLLYSSKITVPVIQMFIATSWAVSLLYNWVLIYFKGITFTYENVNICLGKCDVIYTETWGLVDLIATFILPCSVMVSLYIKIFIVAKRHLRIINSMSQQMVTKERNQCNMSKKSERKAAKTLGIVMAVFLLCWIPYYLCIIFDTYTSFSTPRIVFNAFTWLVFFNSGFNPIIYALFYSWFQKSFKLIMTLRICDPESSLVNLFPENH
ncbi:trace amine-associated receptor 13c-like [Erpetoichthys calabaricus]|uniref:trace amine-associated receptor 13c-like n=1 Tax=Erpetoichthys calabaricus TaxID=27687 RepID=UPI002234AECB|nr:trace amine-associated receptor 13c-like [Erpetoichthys calabaricus]